MDSHQEYVLREVAQKNIRFIRLWFTDVAGVLKSISIDPGELEEAFAEGICSAMSSCLTGGPRRPILEAFLSAPSSGPRMRVSAS